MSSDQWNKVLSASELAASHAATAVIDPRFAKGDEAFYRSRSVNQLRALVHQAWLCCEPTGYQMARSYLALLEAA